MVIASPSFSMDDFICFYDVQSTGRKLFQIYWPALKLLLDAGYCANKVTMVEERPGSKIYSVAVVFSAHASETVYKIPEEEEGKKVILTAQMLYGQLKELLST